MWRCAAKYANGACLHSFNDKAGAGRVLVLANTDWLQDGMKYEIVFLGECNATQDNVINMLKTAKLLEESNWDVGDESMLVAIQKLNEECERKLITLSECRIIRACKREDIEQRCKWTPYCEDERLSINNGGMLYKALYAPPETKSLDDDLRDKVLASLVCFYDLRTSWRSSTRWSAEKKAAYRWMVDQQRAARL